MTTATAERPRGKRAPKAPVHDDPVTRYARAVVERNAELVLPMIRTILTSSGPMAGRTPAALEARARQIAAWTIVVGRAVRQACQRHLTDLARQKTEAFPYAFDAAAAQHIIDFFPTFLPLESGAPFHLPPWLQFSYGFIYGWKCWGGERDGLRRIQHGFFETSKGSGKTPSAGGLGIYGAGYDDEPHAAIFSTGFDKGQASIILNDAIRMVQDSPDEAFREEFIADKYNIAHPPSGSFFRAMSSQHQSKSGPRPQYVLSDEIHEHRDGTVVTKAESGFKNRRQPLGLKYTNSGSDRNSYCWQLHQKSLAILDGSLVDEQWFAYICHLDPCEEHYHEGYRQPKDGCKACDDWTDPAVWPKVAPALGIVIQPKYLQDATEKALSMPSEYSLVRRLNFCIWTETHQVWISVERLEACTSRPVVAADGTTSLVPWESSTNNAALVAAALGLDPSSTHDLTSAVVALRHDDAPGAGTPQEVEIEGMDEQGERVRLAYTLNFSVELIPYFWIPEETLLERVRKERIPYDEWARKGFLFPTPGAAIDHNAIYEFVKDDLWKRFRIQRLGMDENHGRMLFMRLRDDARLGKQVVSVGQAKKLSEAFKFMEILVLHKRLRWTGHPVLKFNFANAEPKRDRLGALWLEKPQQESKVIDGVIASAMAIKELMVLPTRRKSIFVGVA
jgi:phage terminase large subunit-like protein